MTTAGRPIRGWQTIETAPKDGRRIDVWGINTARPENLPGRYTNAFWDSAEGCWMAGHRFQPFPLETPIATATGKPVVKITHWMPLPEPPKAESQS